MSFSISKLFLDNKPACHACIIMSLHFFVSFCGSHVHARSNSVTLTFRWIDYWVDRFFRAKNPEYDFLPKGSKAVDPSRRFTYVKEPQAEIRASE